MNYTQRWQLAVALKQPYPNFRDTGDVAPADDATATSSSGTSISPADVRIAFENMGRAARVLLAVGVGGGLLVGGLVGYIVGKAK
jgi:hypothetical protein